MDIARYSTVRISYHGGAITEEPFKFRPKPKLKLELEQLALHGVPKTENPKPKAEGPSVHSPVASCHRKIRAYIRNPSTELKLPVPVSSGWALLSYQIHSTHDNAPNFLNRDSRVKTPPVASSLLQSQALLTTFLLSRPWRYRLQASRHTLRRAVGSKPSVLELWWVPLLELGT